MSEQKGWRLPSLKTQREKGTAMGLEQVTVASHPVSRMDMGEYLKYLEIHKAQDEWTRS